MSHPNGFTVTLQAGTFFTLPFCLNSLRGGEVIRIRQSRTMSGQPSNTKPYKTNATRLQGVVIRRGALSEAQRRKAWRSVQEVNR